MCRVFACVIILVIGGLALFPILSLLDDGTKAKVPDLSLQINLPKIKVPDKTSVYYEFAKKKHVSLKGIPHELLQEIADDKFGDLLFAVAFVESSLNPKAKTANNYGLMQISDVHFTKYARARRYLKWCGVEHKNDLFNAHKNMCVGRALLYEHLEESRYLVKRALMAYNGSPKRSVYADKVKRTHRELQKLRKSHNK